MRTTSIASYCCVIAFALQFALPCGAEITRAGGAIPGKTIPYQQGTGLIALLDDCLSITCTNAWVSRADGTRYTIDLKKLLAQPGDFPLSDGDIVCIPEHVLPCMSEASAAAYIALFRDYRRIESGEIVRPDDWLQRIETAGTLRDKIPPSASSTTRHKSGPPSKR